MSTYDYLHHSSAAQAAKRAMFARYGRTCHLCGHPGATDADLIVPRSVNPKQQLSPDIYRPAHGVRGCPTCGKKCNQERGNKPVGSMFRPRLNW